MRFNRAICRTSLCVFLLIGTVFQESAAQTGVKATAVAKPSNMASNSYYVSNKAPLLKQYFIKLPVSSIKPGGWLKKALELQRDGLTGNLGEISIWLSKKDNAWLNKEGKGDMDGKSFPIGLKDMPTLAICWKTGA